MYDVSTDALLIGVPIARAFGNSDMYRDDSSAENVYYVEQQFSKLESQAAQVLRKLDIAISGPRPATTVALTRKEVNTLRKFLFLLPYRSQRHASQYLEERFDAKTKIEVETFRQKHDLKDSYAVWLFNLRNMLEAEHWEIPESEKILRSDRDAYTTESLKRQMGFYVAPDDSEFVMTNNGLGLWEGTYLPSFSMMAMMMSPGANPAHTAWKHTTTYPISPRLLVLMRSEVMSQQQAVREHGGSPDDAVSLFGDKIPDNSYFKDFPRTFASVKYDPPLRERELKKMIQSNDPKDLGSRVKDVLTFQLHMLNTDQAARVNSLRLENNPETITFKSPQKLLNSLHQFKEDEGTHGAGAVTGTPTYSKRSYSSLESQLEHYLTHGSPPTSPSLAPATPASPAAGPSSPTRPTAGRSKTAPASTNPATASTSTFAETPAQNMSFLDLLRARSDSSVPKPVQPDPEVEDIPPMKPRKPLMRRQVYDTPPQAKEDMEKMLMSLARLVIPTTRA